MRLSSLAGHPGASHGPGGWPVWPASWWMRALSALMLAAVLVIALATFAALVRRSVHNGEQHRLAMAAYSHEVWRCYALHGRSLRESCVQELKSPGAALSGPFPEGAGPISPSAPAP